MTTHEKIRQDVEAALGQVAPDIELAAADPDENLFDAFDIDSMDFLHLITRLSEQFAVQMPESDYSRMQSITALAEYIADALVQD